MFKLAVSIQETQVVCKSHLSISLCLEYLVKISPGEGEGGRGDATPVTSFLLCYNGGEEPGGGQCVTTGYTRAVLRS